MVAYMLVDVDVRDAEQYAKYRDEVPALIAKHGGEYLVRGGDFDVVEGDWQPHRLVLFRFPSRQAIPCPCRSPCGRATILWVILNMQN